MKEDAPQQVLQLVSETSEKPLEKKEVVHAARAAGTFLNHTLNNSLQAVMYRAELLRDHEDPEVAEAGRWLAECVRAMADTVRMVGSLRKFSTVPYVGSELMLDPACLEGEDPWPH